ncbi:MAG: type II secretion system minor pseudopilin GspI [Cellvibrionaceae bacterium]
MIRHKHNLKKHQNGFTLIEVMAALAVVAIGMAASLHASSQAGFAGSHLKQKTIAHWVATNHATEMQIQKAWPSPGEKTGKTTMGDMEWGWEQKVSKTDVSSLRRVDIRVFAPDDEIDEGNEVTHIVTFLGKP